MSKGHAPVDILFQTRRTEVRKSSVHGWGVFAKEDIEEGIILEQSHGLFIPRDLYDSIDHPSIRCNGFAFPRDNAHQEVIIPFGLGCVYNALPRLQCNANWYCDTQNKLIVYYTIKDIKKDEEIFIDYYTEMLGWEKKKQRI